MIRAADPAPVSDDARVFANTQINELLNTTLCNVLAHQMKNPGSPMGKLVRERGVRARIYDPASEKPPLLIPDPRGVPMNIKDLPADQIELMVDTFQAFDNLMEARHQQDRQIAWTSRAVPLSLRRRVNEEVMRGNFPNTVNVLLNVAQALVDAPDKVEWKTLLEQMQTTRPTPPRGGA